jgi:hypothetical protein
MQATALCMTAGKAMIDKRLAGDEGTVGCGLQGDVFDTRGCALLEMKKPQPRAAGAVLWWAPRESNSAPTDYESAALTKHELEAR